MREQQLGRAGHGERHLDHGHVGRGVEQPQRDPHAVVPAPLRVEHRLRAPRSAKAPATSRARSGAPGAGIAELVERGGEAVEVVDERRLRARVHPHRAAGLRVGGDDDDRARAGSPARPRAEGARVRVVVERRRRRAVRDEQGREGHRLTLSAAAVIPRTPASARWPV